MLKGKVLANRRLANGIYQIDIDYKKLSAKAGQFINVSCPTKTLPRPISVCKSDEDYFSLVYKVVGEGTRWMSQLQKEQEISFTRPLGQGFDITRGEKVAIIGGGMGIAPLLPVAEALYNPHVFLGFNEEDFLIKEFKKTTENLHVSYDARGETVIDKFKMAMSKYNFDTVFACGPKGMLLVLQKLCKINGISGQISIENHMACGVGACLVCNCSTEEGYKLVCTDGPVFEIDEVILND